MKTGLLKAISAASLGFNLASALPRIDGRNLVARQDIDFNLVDSTPDPTVFPEDRSHFNSAAAIASVVAAINAHPLPPLKRSLETRDVVVATYAGYTANTLVGNASMYAPMDCNAHETYMGAKLFTNMAFDTALCAAACSAQSFYNLRHPPANDPAQTCQFYNTYAMYKNDVYQGQYCTLYNQTWDAKYATNTGQYRGRDHYTIQYSYIASNATNSGQCPQAAQAPTKTPLDLTAITVSFDGEPFNLQTKIEKNLVNVAFADGEQDYGLSTRIYFPVIANEIYEISWDYFQQVSSTNNGQYFIEVGDHGYEAVTYWTQNAGSPIQPTSHYSSALSDGTGAEMDACWNRNIVPQAAPASGVWNTGKVILKPRSTSGYFRWDFYAASGGNSLQWKNTYVTKMPSDYCKAGQ
ncbi:MAG: hypothetical protein Q9224_001286 [Gallowayella concinna]